ncbi:hypothetical protein, partial [Staphylococcus devriesei]
TYTFNYYYNKNNLMDKENSIVPDVSYIEITKDNSLIMNVIIYDVINDEWLFRLDSNIRIPENSIYFHSLTWGVDYIKPEIVLMYDLLGDMDSQQLTNYKRVLDALSYYQFVILKGVVGEHKINEVIAQNK